MRIETEQKDLVIEELKPKAAYCERVLNCVNAIAIGVIAKDYGKSAIWLNTYLHEKGIQYKKGKVWLLYADYAERGYTDSKTHVFSNSDGNEHAYTHTFWTQKGRLFIYELLKKDGILPLCEREEVQGA